MSTILLLAGLAAGLFFSAFYSGSETGLYCLDRVRLHLAADRKSPSALRLLKLLADEQSVLMMTLVGTNVANYGTTAAFAAMLVHTFELSEGSIELLTTVLLTPIVFVLAEATPKNIYQRRADSLMYRGSLLLTWSIRILRWTGLLWMLGWLSRTLIGYFGKSSAQAFSFSARHRMAGMLRDAVSHDEERHEFPAYIDGALRLSETTAHELMVPRNLVVPLSENDTRKTFLTAVRRYPFSRFPVLDAHKRRVVGIANVNELLADEGWRSVGERIKDVLTIDPHVTIISVLLKLQQSSEPVAVVTGRSGQLLGLVTLMDVLEEITGDIEQPLPLN